MRVKQRTDLQASEAAGQQEQEQEVMLTLLSLIIFKCALSPIFLWHHIPILISAEWRDLRPPGLARGRRPGSARGLRQGQITLCLSLLLHHDPSRGDAGTDRGHLRRIHARREKAFPGLRDPPVASNAIQGKPFRGRTLHRVSVRWSRMEDSVLEEKFKLQISILQSGSVPAPLCASPHPIYSEANKLVVETE